MDRLMELFNTHLNDDLESTQCKEELVTNVVADYMIFLMQEGHIPDAFLDELEDDLRNEVNTMLTKKMYGFFSLREYRRFIKCRGN